MADDQSLRARLPENWRRVLTTRATVILVLLVALLSVATAVINIWTPNPGPLHGYVPDAIQSAAAFTGALTGFLMVGSALSLRRGLRAGWWATLLLLPLTAAQGLLQSSPYSFPLVVCSIVSIPFLLLTRERFDKSLSLSTTQLAAGAALVGVQVYGTIGGYTLREHFDGVGTGDAVYDVRAHPRRRELRYRHRGARRPADPRSYLENPRKDDRLTAPTLRRAPPRARLRRTDGTDRRRTRRHRP